MVFNVVVRFGADGVNWLVLAKQMAIPTKEYIEKLRLSFSDIVNELYSITGY